MGGFQVKRDERGQLLAFFAIVLVVLIGLVGLVLDGGSTFVQRREQQNVADAAAMAAGYASLWGQDPVAAARTVAAANGYVDGQNGTTVTGSVNGAYATIAITKTHRNYFAGVLGFPSWQVGTTATVVAGVPNAALGALPLIFNNKAFDNPANRSADAPASFSEPASGSNDIPITDASFNWTVYCTASGSTCNADSQTVDALILGSGQDTTVTLADKISPLNAGSHTTLYSDMTTHVGQAFPVGIVDDAGDLVGWAMFHVTGSVGGSTKQVSGWFDTKINVDDMTITNTGGVPWKAFGSYVVKLTN